MRRHTFNRRSRRSCNTKNRRRKGTIRVSVNRRKTYKYGGASKVKTAVKDIKTTAKDIMTKLNVDRELYRLSNEEKKVGSPKEIIENIKDVGKVVHDTVDSIETDISNKKNTTKIEGVSNAIISGDSKDVLNSFDLLFAEIVDNSNLKIKNNNDVLDKFKGDKKSLSKLKVVFDNEKNAVHKLKGEYSKKREELKLLMKGVGDREPVKNNINASKLVSITSIFSGIQVLLLIVLTSSYLSNIANKIPLDTIPSNIEQIMRVNGIETELAKLNKIIYETRDAFKRIISAEKLSGWKNIIIAGVASITGALVYGVGVRKALWQINTQDNSDIYDEADRNHEMRLQLSMNYQEPWGIYNAISSRIKPRPRHRELDEFGRPLE